MPENRARTVTGISRARRTVAIALVLSAAAGQWLLVGRAFHPSTGSGWPEHAEGQARQAASPSTSQDLLDFVEIPAGPFVMGSDRAVDPMALDNERWSSSVPQGMVDLPAFLIARHEVTVAEFRSFVEATKYKIDAQTLRGQPDHPVTFVSWPDALAYCRRLEATLKSTPGTPSRISQLLRDGWRVTLPTEAQWEKAARGTDGRIFPWGSQPRRDRANYESTATTPVGRFECPECPFPVFDMSGNVWEWTRSPYQPYPYDETDDAKNLEVDALWVMRGGHFGDPAQYIRAAARGGADPGARRPFIGFRVVIARVR